MPIAPKKPCNQPGCPSYQEKKGYCIEHYKLKEKQYNKDRGTATQRGYNSRWQKIRDMKWKRNPLCERCNSKGLTVQTEVIHHIDRDVRNNRMDNLLSVCKRCHNEIHKDERWGT